jgi:predicted nuclease of predicted toxin-antitoxin system
MAAFLADECFPMFIVRALRDAGFDVERSADTHPGAPDREVLDLAARERRILLTEDTDFGELAVRLKLPAPGIVRIDLKTLSRDAQAARVVETLARLGDEISGAIVSIEPSRTRIRRLPYIG